MQENKLFEALLDVIPFAAYAVDIETYEVVYANRQMGESMYAPREDFCWKKVYGQEEVCSWCAISELKQRDGINSNRNGKLISSFFDESTDSWLQSYDELVKWPDGRTVKYTIAVDITEQKEIQASMIKNNTKLVMQSQKLQAANKKLEYMSKKDSLTGINNRDNFFKLSSEIWGAPRERKTFLSVIEVDNLKDINSNFGYSVGDTMIKSFASEIKESLEESEIFGRINGANFALVSFADTKEEVQSKLNNIKTEFEIHDELIKISVTFLTVEKGNFKSFETCLNSAEKEFLKIEK